MDPPPLDALTKVVFIIDIRPLTSHSFEYEYMVTLSRNAIYSEERNSE